VWLHEQFLQEPTNFLKNEVYVWKKAQRVSINLFATKGADYKRFMKYYRNSLEDESYFSYILSKKFGHECAMYMNAVACHYAFAPQRKELNKTTILSRYEELALSH